MHNPIPFILAATMLAQPALAAPTDATEESAEAQHPEARPYEEGRDALAEVDASLKRAEARGVATIIVMGANWCHDSRALAGWLQSERFQSLLSAHFETLFVDVGTPQEEGEGRNQEIMALFGMEPQTSTPNMLIVSTGLDLMNADDARSWGNAATRSGDEIYAYLERFAAASTPEAGDAAPD